MNARFDSVTRIERPYTYESDLLAKAGVVTPDRNLALGTPDNGLSLAAVTGCQDTLWLALEERDAARLHERIERKRRSGFALAPGAVAAVNDQRRRFHPITNGAARTSTLNHMSLTPVNQGCA